MEVVKFNLHWQVMSRLGFAKMFLWISFSFLLSPTASCQQDTVYKIEVLDQTETDEIALVNLANIEIGLIHPQTAFKKKLTSVYPALSLAYYRQLFRNKPIFAGIDMSYINLQSFEADIPYLTPEGFEQIWNFSTQTWMMNFGITGRYYLPVNVFTADLFMEFKTGFNWMATQTSYTRPDSEEAESRFNKNDLVGNYGAALGLHIPIHDNSYLQLKIGYIAGLSAYHYTKKQNAPTPVDSTIEAFQLQKSTTDVLKWDIGYTFAF